MPNWCSTNIKVIGPGTDVMCHELGKALYETGIVSPFRKPKIKTDFENWLGRLLEYLGGYTEDEISYDMPCRGWITYCGLDEDTLEIDMESAWSPALEPIMLFKERYAPDASLLYTASEPGCGLYESNDPEVIGTYVIDNYGEYPEFEPDSCWDLSEKDLREILAKAMGEEITDDESTDELIKRASDKFEDISIFKYEKGEYC